MEDFYLNTQNRDYFVESCVGGKVSDSENQPQSTTSPLNEKRVQFSRTQVYYFNRQQGHSSVPQRGGCSLGMAPIHFLLEEHSEAAFRKMRRSEKKLSLANNIAVSTQPSGRGRKRKGSQTRIPAIPLEKDFFSIEETLSSGDDRRVPIYFPPPKLSPQNYDPIESEISRTANTRTPSPPCLSPQKEITGLEVLVDIPETDSETSLDSISKAKTNSQKLLPLPPMARTRLLKQSGVSSIDDSERLSCAWLRNSRINVGCGCLSSFCDPENCSCALAGVPCQVDRPGFPCSCSDQCRNPNGRVEFSASRVRAHALHVLQRLANGNEQPELSSDYGECLQCLQERFALPLPVPSPPSVLVSPAPKTRPLSPPPRVDGLCEMLPAIPVNMGAIVAASTPMSKSIVVYKPPPVIIPPSCEIIEISPERQRSPPTLPVDDVIIIDDDDDDEDVAEPVLEVMRESDLNNDAFLQAKAIFPPASSTTNRTTNSRKTESCQSSTPTSKLNEVSDLNRLSLRKRRIIRSSYSRPFRKRFGPDRRAVGLVNPPPNLARLTEVDAPLRPSIHSPTPSVPTASSAPLQSENT
ncbi:hypothetical protein Aperf_G00000131228 [Anoplocephala perfoliata]